MEERNAGLTAAAAAAFASTSPLDRITRDRSGLLRPPLSDLAAAAAATDRCTAADSSCPPPPPPLLLPSPLLLPPPPPPLPPPVLSRRRSTPLSAGPGVRAQLVALSPAASSASSAVLLGGLAW